VVVCTSYTAYHWHLNLDLPLWHGHPLRLRRSPWWESLDKPLSSAYAVVRCLSVRLSGCLSHSCIMSKWVYVFKLFSVSGRPIILVFPQQTFWQYSDGDLSLTGASNGGEVGTKNCHSWPIYGFGVDRIYIYRVIYSTMHDCVDVRLSHRPPTFLFMTATIDDYAEENRTEFNCTQW